MSGMDIYQLKEKVVSLVHLSPPKDVTKTRHIIGLASYYRKVIANFSDMVKLLTDLTMKNTPFNWSPLCHGNFNAMKVALTASSILILPDPE